MLITKLALPFCNIMHTQLCRFHAVPNHITAHFVALPRYIREIPTRIFFYTRLRSQEPHCCSLASAVALDVKTSNFYWSLNEIVEQGESKYNQKFLVIFPSRNNYNALKDILEIVFNFFSCKARARQTGGRERRRREKRDLRAIQMVKGFIETNNGHS